MNALVAYGSYLPHHRLDLADIGAVLGAPGGRGGRTVAGYDEDATSMAVEAGRAALAGFPRDEISSLVLAIGEPPYLDRTNAAAAHAALRLPGSALAMDLIGSTRAGAAALATAAANPGPTLAVLSDLRGGLPGGADERGGGDAAAAFVLARPRPDRPALAEVLATTWTTDELFDRWRVPGEPASHVWEERFAEGPYTDHGLDVLHRALREAGVEIDSVDHLIVAGLHQRAARAAAARSGARREAVTDTLATRAGNPGTAQAGLLLADVLDRAGAGEVVALVVLGDGASCLVLRTTAALAKHRAPVTVASQLAGGAPVSYGTFLTWRGHLIREPPRRPDPQPTAAPPAHRATTYKYGLVVGRCSACGTVNIPAEHVCVRCGAVDTQQPHPLAERGGRVVTFSIDHLAFSPSPPVIAAVVDFAGGGRLICELTDVEPGGVFVGMPVRMTFRRTASAAGVHNYFWKARPDVPAVSGEPANIEVVGVSA
ncbi:OB-fold domain-containing protein [Amycolatopsis sp. YIM 10]|uniref:OB-fold domain-containing protein n=1 Tax=Amycolatopsis sp. YIM 10 TaxID=2653857 RepID=UPI00128FD372|nr:OB-fold domain-containing protein [Amycolatopsis sp. YIM 10]QFU89565.1 hypothetical protein YIM_21935 [Amycolatopsis sp. YIM 10]